jgi:L-lactate utilization protein LutC
MAVELSAKGDPRTEIMAAIRARLRESEVHDQSYLRSHSTAPPPAELEPRALSTVSLLDQFQERLAAVGGQCRVVTDETQAVMALATIVEKCGARRIAISDAPRVARLAAGLNKDVTVLSQPTAAELFACDLGVTTAQWAIAESGTLVLESDRERHRLVSLVPPVHVAFLEVSRICRTMAEILHEMHQTESGLSRAVTFITGTSRTSDIELTLAIGVHGPAELHVIIITGGAE